MYSSSCTREKSTQDGDDDDHVDPDDRVEPAPGAARSGPVLPEQSADDAESVAETMPYDDHDVENPLATGPLTDQRQLLEHCADKRALSTLSPTPTCPILITLLALCPLDELRHTTRAEDGEHYVELLVGTTLSR